MTIVIYNIIYTSCYFPPCVYKLCENVSNIIICVFVITVCVSNVAENIISSQKILQIYKIHVQYKI